MTNRLAMIFGAVVISASAQAFTCYEMRMPLPKDLTGSGVKNFLRVGYRLCVNEKNIAPTGDRDVDTGEFTVSIRDGDFVTGGYRTGFRYSKKSLHNLTTVYADTLEKLHGDAKERITISLGTPSNAPGAYLGQAAIGGSVYGLFKTP